MTDLIGAGDCPSPGAMPYDTYLANGSYFMGVSRSDVVINDIHFQHMPRFHCKVGTLCRSLLSAIDRAPGPPTDSCWPMCCHAVQSCLSVFSYSDQYALVLVRCACFSTPDSSHSSLCCVGGPEFRMSGATQLFSSDTVLPASPAPLPAVFQ